MIVCGCGCRTKEGERKCQRERKWYQERERVAGMLEGCCESLRVLLREPQWQREPRWEGSCRGGGEGGELGASGPRHFRETPAIVRSMLCVCMRDAAVHCLSCGLVPQDTWDEAS